ncbi:hypothetical protein [uncultured Lamprocystis sp.]|jgi:hypothetical protein|uniref:hypothetical protein n=1 Tax=uncultured Lamprocystis sp. TaxID=543132 RepID=UPI0025EC89C3|nr:hypothetical protein [uncultured Lamprocystis sp.]
MASVPLQIRSKAGRWGTFANTGTEGVYDFSSQLISFNGLEEKHIVAVKNCAPAGRFKVLVLAAHEYTHWLDHVSTIWGRRSLCQFYTAFHARIQNDEYRFAPAIVNAWDEACRIRSDVYFQVLGEQESAERWAMVSTVGVRFNEKGIPNESDPIALARFFNPTIGTGSRNEELIVRTPLSVVALTECTAQAAEYQWIAREKIERGRNTPANPQQWLADLLTDLYLDFGHFCSWAQAPQLTPRRCRSVC